MAAFPPGAWLHPEYFCPTSIPEPPRKTRETHTASCALMSLQARAAAVAQESAEVERLQKQLLQQERELSQLAAQLAKDAAEADVKSREAGRLVAQVGLNAASASAEQYASLRVSAIIGCAALVLDCTRCDHCCRHELCGAGCLCAIPCFHANVSRPAPAGPSIPASS